MACNEKLAFYLLRPKAHVITGNLNVIPDARLRNIISKGRKYEFPSNRPVILANIWVKPTTNCYRNEKCIFEIYNPICISEKSPQMLHDGKYKKNGYESGT